jgi:hypothetical protein
MNRTPALRRTKRRLTAAAAVAASGLALTTGGVLAALNATAFNTTAQPVSSGTLRLTLADNGAGFSIALSNLAPGDVANRFVTLTNAGTLDATGLTLGVADTVNSKLTTDAVNGLRVTVSSCPTAWNPTAGTCTVTPTVISTTPLATLKTTPGALSSATVPAGAAMHLRLAIALPDQTETTVNGVLPSNTTQGTSANLTWTFTQTQRAAVSTNS